MAENLLDPAVLQDHLVRGRIAASPYDVAREKNTGIPLPLDPDLIDPGIVQAIRNGAYEAAEAIFAQKVVADGDAVLELGAGIGFISTVVCLKHRVASYLAVEANAHLLPLIAETHRLNGVHGVDVLNAAVTSDPQQLAAGKVSFASNRLFWASRVTNAPPTSTTTVPTAPLSDILRERAISVIIADIEGAEGSLFADVDLSNVRSILLEIHPHILKRQGVRRIFSQLMRQQLIYDASCSRGKVVTFTRDAF